jgi:hypothetical protein
VTQIKIALTNVAPSTNNATIQLAADNAGVPGAILGSWSVAQQPPFGGCCALTTVNVSPSIPVGYGKHYWVIANPGPNAFQNTEDGWNLTYNLSGGNVSFNSTGTGYTWETFYTYAVAMQVLGCGKLCGVG